LILVVARRPADKEADVTQIRPVDTSGVRAAISRAAQRTNTDFNYLLAQARIESGLNPGARSNASSAAGLYQFVDRTWRTTLGRHGAAHGLDVSTDPARRAEMMALRFDPETAATMAGELANDNRDALRGAIGREPGSTDLYLAHFLGAAGAASVLKAVSANPGQSAATLLPEAARANRAIFYDRAGSPRSVGDLYQLIDTKMQRAMAAGGNADPEPVSFAPAQMTLGGSATPASGPIAREFAAAAPAGLPATVGRSMAETLRTTFGTDGTGGGSARLARVAYERFQALGL
jgi:Transglycosylase SLT domain